MLGPLPPMPQRLSSPRCLATIQTLIFIACTLAPIAKADERPSVILHRQGGHECHTFRIPGIARSNAGTLLAVFDMRHDSPRDLLGHMDIGLSRSTDGGKTWSAPRPVMDMGTHGGLPENQNGCSDPNILVDTATGTVSPRPRDGFAVGLRN
jgi:sialidase-1